ncbi:PilX N-terminal domain-containing pilus assembly protein [Roseateles sp.]|uniref:PilX N-terminal domain-containing pilus assembly protein n=1 Tax=Roseateles sp. TaxID=1971397 RepID=UPI0032634CCA
MKLSICSWHSRQRGAATLVVVMVLFLVMALLAAYANRSLLFEQRIASSYFRASVAQEVAEAGVEWTLAQLNGTAIDAACKPVDTGGQRFADRYLLINTADRRISPADTTLDCARDTANEGWSCRCPATSAAHTAQTAVAGSDLVPSFNIGLQSGNRGGTLTLKALGCTDSVADQCDSAINMVAISKNQLARTNLTVKIGLVGAVRSPPAAPLVVRGDIASTGAGLGLHNGDPRSAGQLAVMGGSWTGKVDGRLESVPGTATGQVVIETDTTLADTSLTAEGVFKMFMGTNLARYRKHPALRTVTCASDCATALETAYTAGQRILWVQGNLRIASSKVLGSVSDPVLIVANGDVTLAGPLQINGMLVATGALAWSNDSAMPSVVNGMVLVGGGMATSGRMDVIYQQAVADQMRNRLGSYVRIPGGWIDIN